MKKGQIRFISKWLCINYNGIANWLLCKNMIFIFQFDLSNIMILFSQKMLLTRNYIKRCLTFCCRIFLLNLYNKFKSKPKEFFSFLLSIKAYQHQRLLKCEFFFGFQISNFYKFVCCLNLPLMLKVISW